MRTYLEMRMICKWARFGGTTIGAVRCLSERLLADLMSADAYSVLQSERCTIQHRDLNYAHFAFARIRCLACLIQLPSR
jgi:hypothetical protein